MRIFQKPQYPTIFDDVDDLYPPNNKHTPTNASNSASSSHHSSSSSSFSSSSSSSTSLASASAENYDPESLSSSSSSSSSPPPSRSYSFSSSSSIKTCLIRANDYVGDRANSWMRALMLFVGPLFVLIAMSLIAIVAYIHVGIVIPLAINNDFSSWQAVVHFSMSAYILFNLVFNYAMAIWTPPGVPPRLKLDEETLDDVKKDFRSKPGVEFSRYCKTCRQVKPIRTHHCHICNKCILKMDHHCPWINNCVGHFNHKYFVLFMFYMATGCGYCAAFSFFPFLETLNFDTPWPSEANRGGVIFQFILTISVMIAVGGLLSWHFYLLLTNQTTIEFYHNSELARFAKSRGLAYQNDYDIGYKRNFESFFGPGKYWFSWTLASTAPTPGDGLNYETKRLPPDTIGSRGQSYERSDAGDFV